MHGKRSETHDIYHQGIFELESMFKRGCGTSKHKDKIKNHDDPTIEKSIPDTDKIYAKSTLQDYKRKWGYMCEAAKKQGKKLKNMNDVKAFLPEYLDQLKEKDLSAWTIRSYISPATKILGVSQSDYDIPLRHADDIKRSRREDTVRSKDFAIEKHQDLISFCHSVGPRNKKELSKIRGTDLAQNKKGEWGVNIYGKGGKYRFSRIYGTSEQIKSTIDLMRAAGDNLVFDRVPSHANVHRYRAGYAARIYNQYARPLAEIPRKDRYWRRGTNKGKCYDKAALSIAAIELGHSDFRHGVVVGNYSYLFDAIEEYTK